MKKKFLLPMLAMIFAVGMAFATERSTANPAADYILQPNGQFLEIAELNCGEGTDICTVRMVEGGPEFVVYDDARLGTEKEGATDAIEYWKIQN